MAGIRLNSIIRKNLNTQKPGMSGLPGTSYGAPAEGIPYLGSTPEQPTDTYTGQSTKTTKTKIPPSLEQLQLFSSGQPGAGSVKQSYSAVQPDVGTGSATWEQERDIRATEAKAATEAQAARDRTAQLAQAELARQTRESETSRERFRQEAERALLLERDRLAQGGQAAEGVRLSERDRLAAAQAKELAALSHTGLLERERLGGERSSAAAAAEREGIFERDRRTQEAERAALLERDRLNREGEERSFGRFKEVSALPLPGEGSGGAGDGTAPAFDEGAARSAAFARAKDQAGQTARASLTSLREALGSRGMLGGGAETVGTANIIGGAGQDVGDFTREQLIQDLDRSSKVADRDYAGKVTKRGQDLDYRQSLLALLNSGKGLY